ncbi:MAG: hypothetical protein IK017_08740 [Paludibacteraceae bacterium]|nr:hypothetical protein [Paludibacteraceae bacterium]MBR5972722.1 hypothetical protein [Paludibacteraceae bacterium]
MGIVHSVDVLLGVKSSIAENAMQLVGAIRDFYSFRSFQECLLNILADCYHSL